MRLNYSTRSPFDLSLLEIAAQETGSEGFSDDARAVGAFAVTPEGEPDDLRAITVFQNVTSAGAEVHFCGTRPGWATPRVLAGFFRIAFDRWGYRMLRAPIPAVNVPAQVLALKCGFQFEGRLRGGAADGSDAILFSMAPEECRWLLPTSGNVVPMTTAQAAE